MVDSHIPDLTLPGTKSGKFHVMLDLLPLLYRGGAGTRIRNAPDLVASGKLGTPILNRVPLVALLHENLAAKLAGGASVQSIYGAHFVLRKFYEWIDLTMRDAVICSVEDDFIAYSEHLLQRVRVTQDLRELNAYYLASGVSAVLDDVLDLKIGLLARTRLSKPKAKKQVLGTLADKQNLEELFSFGHLLIDVAEALTVDALRGTLPVTIQLRSGLVLEEWCYLKNRTAATPSNKDAAQRREPVSVAELLHLSRRPLVNLRMEAELLIFIAQTGMNLAQAKDMRAGAFRYQSYLDGYRVHRVFKGRRSGEVEFEIFSEYRPFFERYLSWREIVFPGGSDDRLFPFISKDGATGYYMDFQAIRRRCRRLNVRCLRPRRLRNARINWLLRRSRDPHLTADMSQHSQRTLLHDYDQPNHQVAVAEIVRFFQGTDPALASVMPGPGACEGDAPRVDPLSPSHASKPDCIGPAGCLFCLHQRDIDTKDHVWSLATYRFLKSLELSLFRPSIGATAPHPAEAAIDRVTEKLKRFESSSEVRSTWVRDALDRVQEGDHHPKWGGFIRLMELRA